MEIDGLVFELKKKGSIVFFMKSFNRTLFDCYKTPSFRKQNIWNYWNRMLEPYMSELCCGCFVNSYNSNFFTIGGCIKVNNVYYNILITPAHNYISEI